ncbi:MAG: hypothetical protein HGB12_10280 [Bacteroidetes bacterium]|nr:hypothetical protein [Bacteroidota bacterium]
MHIWKKHKYNKWHTLLMLIAAVIFILSLRLLSDPDLGFHLNAGRWIIENLSFPDKDTFTFTATQNDYIDLHWLFQVFIFIVFKISGYEGLSILVAVLSIVFLFVILKRNNLSGIPLYISILLLLTGFLIIESRITLRPEMFSFIFITILLLLLDSYCYRQKKVLFLLPVIMLFWCNMHSLFILGLVITVVYFISISITNKRLDKYFMLWMLLSFSVCLVNPYFIKGLTFPLELFSRFDSNNIFNQHIKEFSSFLQFDKFYTKDILFIIFVFALILLVFLTLKKRKIHELILLPIFLYLALISIRNIPLFVIVAIPIAGASAKEITDKFKKKKVFEKMYWTKNLLFYLALIFCHLFMFRLFSNAFYYSNGSYYKTGVGIDVYQQPEKATEFIIKNNLKGRILNSIGFGGWIGWKTHQPVFIDGRLEVMKETLYNEIVESWNDGLPQLIYKYKPELIVYNYQKYYKWTDQILKLPEWKLIYIDGNAAIFIQKENNDNIPLLNIEKLPGRFNLPSETNDQEVVNTLNVKSPSLLETFTNGFYKNVDYTNIELINLGSFCLQIKEYKTAERFLLEALRKTQGSENQLYFALSEIYRLLNDTEKSQICFNKILSFDPQNKIVLSALGKINNTSAPNSETTNNDSETKAKLFFNSGNKKYQNGDIQGAINDYCKATELKPDYYKAYNNRAIIKSVDLKNDTGALKDFNKAIEINGEYADAYLGRGTSKYNLKDYKGACNDWAKASSLGNLQAEKQINMYCK